MHPVRLNLSAMVQCFSLTIKHHQPVYQPQKSSSEQHVDSSIAGNRSLNYSDPWFSGPAEKLQHCLRPATSWNRGNVPRDKLFTREFCVQKLLSLIQPVRLLVLIRAYQAANNIFLSYQTSTSQAYQPRSQPADRPIDNVKKSNDDKLYDQPI